MLTAALALAAVAWLPGAAIFRLPWLERDRRAALDAEERLFWAIVISVALSLAIVLALAAMGQYSFTRLLVCDAGIAAAAVAIARFRVRLGSAARRPGLSCLIPIGLVILCLWRFFPTSEYIAGGKDPGNYLNEGVQIAQRGSLLIHDPAVSSVPPFARDLFFPSHQHPAYYSTRFMGFFLQNPDTGLVVGQFPHLFPASIAIGQAVQGLSGARRTVGVWALLGVLAVYFAGARLIGRRAAGVAAALLALHVIETWFARYPNVEVVMQALLFAALLANARAHVDGDRFFAPVAGFLLALLLFARYDVVLMIAGIAFGLVLGLFQGKRPHWSFLAILAVGAALAAPYWLVWMRASAAYPLAFARNLTWWHLLLLTIAALIAIAAVIIAIRRPRLAASVTAVAPTALAVMVVLLAVYALFIRQPGGRLAAADAYAFRTFTYLYFTLPAIIAAVAGFALLARRAFWRDPALICTVTLLSLFLFYKPRIIPEHFWMARRFLPVVLPGALLCVAAAAFVPAPAGGSRTRRLLRPLLGVVFAGLLAAHYARASAAVVEHVEYQDLIPRVEKLANQIGNDDVLIVESRDAGSDVHLLATPLAYIYAKNVLLLHSARPDKPTFAAFLEWAGTKYARVLFLGSGGTDLLSHRYGLEPLASDRFQVPEFETPHDQLPRGARRKEFDYGLYRFVPAASREGLWFDLDVGVRDDLHVVRFHAKEQTGDISFRWTGRQSFVTVTTVPPASTQVTLVMSNGGRPAAAPPADVQVFFHNQLLGTVRVSEGFRPYQLPIPPALAAQAAALGDPVELRLVTTVWNPAKLLGTPDDRDLGVMVDRVAVR